MEIGVICPGDNLSSSKLNPRQLQQQQQQQQQLLLLHHHSIQENPLNKYTNKKKGHWQHTSDIARSSGNVNEYWQTNTCSRC